MKLPESPTPPPKKISRRGVLGLAAAAMLAGPPRADASDFVAACAWPDGQTLTYVAPNGDIYEVTVYNPNEVGIKASIMDGAVIVQATYQTPSSFPLSVNMVTTYSPYVTPPPQFVLESGAYKFEEAATKALEDTYGRRTAHPLCPPEIQVNGLRPANPGPLLGYTP